MNTFDVSLVLAAYREGALLRSTLLSLCEAARHARSEGITIELVAALDRADEPTRQVVREFGSDKFDGWTVLEVDHGSPGATRNSGVKAARGRYIYISNGDDLVSFNSFAAMFSLAERAGPAHLIYHQYMYGFGSRYRWFEHFPLDTVTPLAFLEQHPYTSSTFAPRAVFETVPFTNFDGSSGYAYEDWHFNAECVARGYRILIAGDTIRFFRQHRGGRFELANSHATGQIPPSTLFEPHTWVRVTRDAYERFATLGATRSRAREGAGSGAPDRAPLDEFIRAAKAIDPGIDPWVMRGSTYASNLADLAPGLAYHEICQIIGCQRFDEVFLMPFIATGGAERYVGHVMQALYEIRPTARMLMLLGEPLAGGSYIDRVPPNVTVLELANDWPQLSMEQRHLIVLKLIQSVAPQARLHLRLATICEGFYGKFKSILRSHPTVFYRFGDIVEGDRTAPLARPGGFNFVADHVKELALIVADNKTIIERDWKRIAVCAKKWRWLPARQSPGVSVAEAVARTATPKGRLLWASRLDRQKRPELLRRIANRLNRLAPDMQIDVFGSAVLDTFDLGSLAGLANLSYRGAYDGFAALDHGAYDAFVYTSVWDGMPNVVLEAIAMGLPVIAPDVGGIAEIIIDGESGLLLPSLTNDDEMAAAYTAAIIRLANDAALRAKLVAGALRLLADRHTPAAFAKSVQAIFA
jgi:glycosyltransferase involved in cell wall biosynthesis